MASNTYSATLKYYDSTYGWSSESTCSQGNCTPWGGGSSRVGIMFFSGLSALKGMTINKVTITVGNQPSGENQKKTAYFYASAAQGGVNTSLKANHKTGSTIFTWEDVFHQRTNATCTTEITSAFASRIAAGEDTFCIYSASSTHYLKWNSVSITVEWTDPNAATTGWTVTTGTIGLGSTVTVAMPTLSGANANNYHKVTYNTSGGHTGTIASALKSGESATLETALDWGIAIPNAAQMTLTIICTTYRSNGDKVGENSLTRTLVMPNNSSTRPTFSFTVAAVDPGGNNAYVAGHSKALIKGSALNAKYGATISKYSIKIADNWEKTFTSSVSSFSQTSGVLSSGGSKTVTVTVTDSRGFSASSSTTIAITAYSSPLISTFRAFRTASSTSTSEDPNGSYMRVVITPVSGTSISGNTITGTLTCTPAVSGLPSSITSSYAQNFEISNGVSYTLTYIYQDDYTTVKSTQTVSATAVPFQVGFNGTSFNIGKAATEANIFDCAYNMKVRKNLTVEGSLILTAEAKASLGMGCTQLYSGSLSGTASTSFSYSGYSAYVIIGKPGSTSDLVTMFIPRLAITTSDTVYQIADNEYWVSFSIKYVGDTVTLTCVSNNGNGSISKIYGIN